MSRIFQWFLLIFLFIDFSISECSNTFIEHSCPMCCAILFSSENCRIDSVHSKFNVKDNGNGVLGAIWDDAPKAVIVRKGCLLEVWDWKNQTGPKRAFGLEGRDVFQLEKYAFENRISSLKCRCIKSPIIISSPPPLPITDLSIDEEEINNENSGEEIKGDEISTIQIPV